MFQVNYPERWRKLIWITLINISVMRAVNITQHYQIIRVKSAWWTQIKPFVMQSYNKLPSTYLCWSTMKSMFNTSIWNAIFRCGFKLLFSKFHFNDPQKPQAKILLWRKSNGLNQKTFVEARFELADIQTMHVKKHMWESTTSKKETKKTVCSICHKENRNNKW